MEINYNIVSTIHIFGFLQGLILGLLLLHISRKRNRSTRFLAFFVLTYSYCFIPIILEDMNILDHYPRLKVLPRPGEWLLGALFFIYIQRISILTTEKVSYWWVYPGLVIVFLQLIVFFLPVSLKVEISEAVWYRPVFLLGHLFSTFILIQGIRILLRHTKEVENQYSNVESRNLLWVKRFLIFAVVLFIGHFLSFLLYDSVAFRIIYASLNVFVLYWAAINGVMQQNILPVIPKADRIELIKNTGTSQKETTLISFKEMQAIVDQVNSYIKDSEVYIDKNLTIASVAEALKIHPKRISMSINKICQENFNSYINRYRIEKAEKMLTDRNLINLSIEGIGIEVGFQSKSAFYSAFKRKTGTTPNQYKEKLAS
ncbi:MAG: helix-turn-helix domain-containing protein [Bacteroidota bacterium]